MGKKLKYFVFDFDDNILHMNTRLYMEKKINNSWEKVIIYPDEFVDIKEDLNFRPIDNNWNKAFIEFSDRGRRGEKAFISDIKKSLNKNSFGPCYEDFIKCIVEARIFSVITARSHSSLTIRKGVEYIINNQLTPSQLKEMKENIKSFRKIFKEQRTNNLLKSYLDQCMFFGVGIDSPDFEYFLVEHGIDGIDTPNAKKIAFKIFVERVRSYSKRKIDIGFSDDDPKNIKSIKDVIKEIEKDYPRIDFSVFHSYGGKKNQIVF